MGVGGQHHAPAALTPGKARYPLYRRLGGPQGRSGRVRKTLLPPGFDSRTVRPVASRYTDCSIPAPHQFLVQIKNYNNKLMQHVRRMDCSRLSQAIMKYRTAARRNTGRPLTFRNLASYIYRTGVKLPSRCPILYLFNRYPY